MEVSTVADTGQLAGLRKIVTIMIYLGTQGVRVMNRTHPPRSQNSRGPCLAMVLLQNIIKELTPNANAFSALDVVF